jgi:hypothetical protein
MMIVMHGYALPLTHRMQPWAMFECNGCDVAGYNIFIYIICCVGGPITVCDRENPRGAWPTL